MEFSALKTEVYQLAGVSSTRQLKARYQPLASLNLRLKASWEKALDFFQANPVAQPAQIKTLSQLKSEVYALAQVSTPQQLKAKVEATRALNFSQKASWEKALALLQADQSFQGWLSHPPEEYKDLFAEIESATTDLNKSLNKAQRLGQEAREMALSLEEQTAEVQKEAARLRQDREAARRLAQQAELN
ncbi:MAG: hypothetical protein ICV62_14840 [Cyanobacteria bacterium Co-bin13]|nr:hypothetical protein [Cyanobacteria bacterium Co-bin13]